MGVTPIARFDDGTLRCVVCGVDHPDDTACAPLVVDLHGVRARIDRYPLPTRLVVG